jgi:hypothetical protein
LSPALFNASAKDVWSVFAQCGVGVLPVRLAPDARAAPPRGLDLEVSAGWASPPSRGLWGGDARLLPTLLEIETPTT